MFQGSLTVWVEEDYVARPFATSDPPASKVMLLAVAPN